MGIPCFANVVYSIPKSDSEPYASPTEKFAISSMLHTATPSELKGANVKSTDGVDSIIDDFTHNWRDWYRLEAANPHHWEFSTRKLADPKWRGEPGQKLALEVSAEKANELVIVLTNNVFRSYRGKQEEYVAVVKLNGGPVSQTISLSTEDFLDGEGKRLPSWQLVDQLTFRAYYERGKTLLGTKTWAGSQPIFYKLCWWTTSTHQANCFSTQSRP